MTVFLAATRRCCNFKRRFTSCRFVTHSATSPCGWLALNKPKGMTSHAVVDVVRRALKFKRIGHSGTLDPAVSQRRHSVDATLVTIAKCAGYRCSCHWRRPSNEAHAVPATAETVSSYCSLWHRDRLVRPGREGAMRSLCGDETRTNDERQVLSETDASYLSEQAVAAALPQFEGESVAQVCVAACFCGLENQCATRLRYLPCSALCAWAASACTRKREGVGTALQTYSVW